MKLSDTEKLILIMLCEIYEKLGIKGGIEPEFVKQTIYNDQPWGLTWRYTGIFKDTETPAIVRDVVDILNMWSMIERAYGDLPIKEKKALGQAVRLAGDIKFHGFDANHDEHYSIAHYIINELERFAEFKGRDLNSHAPVLNSYRRMLAVFEPIRSILGGRSLTLAELTEILKARISDLN